MIFPPAITHVKTAPLARIAMGIFHSDFGESQDHRLTDLASTVGTKQRSLTRFRPF
jgi:hypothetical protein